MHVVFYMKTFPPFSLIVQVLKRLLEDVFETNQLFLVIRVPGIINLCLIIERISVLIRGSYFRIVNVNVGHIAGTIVGTTVLNVAFSKP
mgnify:FL=1